jgi:RHS repeat-associated protein
MQYVPSTFAIRYVYNNFGYLDLVKRKDNNAIIWDATTMNSFNQYTRYSSGNDLVTNKTYDCMGLLRGITTGTIQSLGYSFNEETGNLISRRDNKNNLIEIFDYDNIGRLTAVSGPIPLSTSYSNNGNITSKTSVGDYSYGTKPHAVTAVTNPVNMISTADQRITYTSFNKVDSIIQSNYKYTLLYGQQDQRTRSKLLSGTGTLLKTVYYAGSYEKELVPGNPYPKELHYIYGGDGLAAIFSRTYGSDSMYYVHKDHLGSLHKVSNAAGIVVQSTSFDAWGRRRNPANWTYTSIPATKFSRGYTGHEHLDEFGLTNMNGRMYDPILGRFLSADKFVQNPFGTQAYNRYSYCMGNPLAYTDPSGYLLKSFWSLVDDLWNRAGKNGGAGWSESGGLWSSDFSEYGIFSGYSSYEVPRFSVSTSGGSSIITGRGLQGQPWQWGHPKLPKLSINYLGTKTVWYSSYSYGGYGVNGANINGGDPYSLYFNGNRLSIISNDGEGVFSVHAVSGSPDSKGNFNYSIKRQNEYNGPIPAGKYYVNTNEIQKMSLYDNVEGTLGSLWTAISGKKLGGWPGGSYTWGSGRLDIHGVLNTNRTGGFTIHGGASFGSAGCIDTGPYIDSFLNSLIENSNGNTIISLYVNYEH